MATTNPRKQHIVEYLLRCDALRCLKCNYDLRGLEGEPLRCPECGHENALLILTTAAAQDDYPPSVFLGFLFASCALPILGFLLGVAIAFIPSVPTLYWVSWWGIALAGWLLIGLASGWASQFLPDWFKVYCLYSLVSLIAITSLVAIIAAFLYLVVNYHRALMIVVVVLGFLLRITSRQPRDGPYSLPFHVKARHLLGKIQKQLDSNIGINRRRHWIRRNR